MQIGVEFALCRKLYRVIATFALRKVAVNDGQRAQLGGDIRHDDAPLCFGIVTREAFTHRQRCHSGQQGDAVVAFLAMVVQLIPQMCQILQRKHIVMYLGFLQTDHVRAMLLNDRRELMGRARSPLMLKEINFMDSGR